MMFLFGEAKKMAYKVHVHIFVCDGLKLYGCILFVHIHGTIGKFDPKSP